MITLFVIAYIRNVTVRNLIIQQLEIINLKSATIIKYTIKGRFMSR